MQNIGLEHNQQHHSPVSSKQSLSRSWHLPCKQEESLKPNSQMCCTTIMYPLCPQTTLSKPGTPTPCNSGRTSSTVLFDCGVLAKDHLITKDPLLYRFHIYYQMRHILGEIQTPLPQDQAWDAINNPYDRRIYEICAKFSLQPGQHSSLTNRRALPAAGLNN